MKYLTVIFWLIAATCFAQKLERNPGPYWPPPHGSCLMCLGNHLIGSHGYSRSQINLAGYSQWDTLHQNSHNPPPPERIYAPSPDSAIEKLIEVAGLKAGDLFVDLGSGDGRVVNTVAEVTGCTGVGVELDEEKVAASRQAGLSHKTLFLCRDAMDADISHADVVYVYLEVATLKKLVPKFKAMKVGARLYSYQHQVPELTGQQFYKTENGKLFVWTAPKAAVCVGGS